MGLLFQLVYGVCAQRPDHSLFIAGVQLPLEARMGGIFGGFLLGMGYFLALGRMRAMRFPSGAVGAILLVFIALMSADGFNALLADLGRAHLYSPSNPLRFATGLLCGLALAAFSLPSVASVLWKHGDWEAPLQTPDELLGALGLLTLFWLLVIADLPYLLYPVSLFLVAGVLAAFILANAYGLSLVRPWGALNWSDTRRPLAVAAALGIVELLALGLVRTWLFAGYGINWVA